MRKSLVIILIGVLVVVWLQTMYTILVQMSASEPTVHVSATIHYTGKNLSSDPSATDRGKGRAYPQPLPKGKGGW